MALVVGSAAPDLAYAIDGVVPIPVFPLSHEWRGIFLFCLPVTIICCWLIRWAAPTIAVHLPTRPTWLALRDYAVLGNDHPPLPVTVFSAILAAASHIAWDRLTVEYIIIEHASSVIGALATLGLAVYIGQRRLLRAWHGAPKVPPAQPKLFWCTAAATTALVVLVVLFLPGVFLPHILINRLLAAVAIGLLTAALVVKTRGSGQYPIGHTDSGS